MRLNATTTQEKAWMLRAAYELTRQKTPLNILVNGKPAHAARRRGAAVAVDWRSSTPGITLLNKGDAHGVAHDLGAGHACDAAAADGERPDARPRAIWTMSGTPADLANLHQNDRVMIVLTGQMPNNFYRQMGAIDLLPAGLEIEKPLTGDEGKPYRVARRARRHDDGGCARRPLRGGVQHRLGIPRRSEEA